MDNLEFGALDDASNNGFDDVPQAVDVYGQAFREVQIEEEIGFKHHSLIEHQEHMLLQIQTPSVFLGPGAAYEDHPNRDDGIPSAVPQPLTAGDGLHRGQELIAASKTTWPKSEVPKR